MEPSALRMGSVVNTGAKFTWVMLILKGAVEVALSESVTRRVKLKVPAVAGLPERVAPPSVSPGGSVPLSSVQVKAGVPPVAVKVYEYAAASVPAAGAGVVTMLGAGGANVIAWAVSWM